MGPLWTWCPLPAGPWGLPPGSNPMTGESRLPRRLRRLPTGPSPHRQQGPAASVTATETRGFAGTAGPRPHSLRGATREPARNADPQAPPRWAASGALGHSLRSVSLGGLPCAWVEPPSPAACHRWCLEPQWELSPGAFLDPSSVGSSSSAGSPGRSLEALWG